MLQSSHKNCKSLPKYVVSQITFIFWKRKGNLSPDCINIQSYFILLHRSFSPHAYLSVKKKPKKAILTCALKFLISHQSQKSFPKNYVINTEQLHFWGVQGAVRFIEGCSNRSKKDWDHNEFWCLWPEWDFPNLRDIKTQVSPFFYNCCI